MKKRFSLRKLFSNTFEGHKGRPNQRGGSLPRGQGSSKQGDGVIAPSEEVFSGKGKLPSGWSRGGDKATKKLSTKTHGDYKIIVEWNSGYTGHLVALGDMRSPNFLPNSPTLDRGDIEWENMQTELDSLMEELSKL